MMSVLSEKAEVAPQSLLVPCRVRCVPVTVLTVICGRCLASQEAESRSGSLSMLAFDPLESCFRCDSSTYGVFLLYYSWMPVFEGGFIGSRDTFLSFSNIM